MVLEHLPFAVLLRHSPVHVQHPPLLRAQSFWSRLARRGRRHTPHTAQVQGQGVLSAWGRQHRHDVVVCAKAFMQRCTCFPFYRDTQDGCRVPDCWQRSEHMEDTMRIAPLSPLQPPSQPQLTALRYVTCLCGDKESHKKYADKSMEEFVQAGEFLIVCV